MRDWNLLEQNHATIKAQPWEVAVLPLGATEPHNLHMPYGTDVFEAQAIADKACEFAFQRGARAICLPTLPFGVNTNHLKVPGGLACSITPTTLIAILTDLVDALERQGIRKIVFLNGHGGNEIKPAIRELHHRTKAFLCVCDFWRIAPDAIKEIFHDPGDHAGELETSLGMAFFPQFMAPLSQADDGRIAPTRLDAINEGWISITRPWHLATNNTGAGNPSQATAEKGKAFFDVITDKLGRFLVQLAQTPMSDRFPY